MAQQLEIVEENRKLQQLINKRIGLIKNIATFIIMAVRKYGEIEGKSQVRQVAETTGVLETTHIKLRSTVTGDSLSRVDVFAKGKADPYMVLQWDGPLDEDRWLLASWHSEAESEWLTPLIKMMRPGQLEKELRKVKMAKEVEDRRLRRQSRETLANGQLKAKAKKLGLRID